MIGKFGISTIGTAHIEKGVVCQDSSETLITHNGYGIAVIADGIGSAAHSDIGSAIAAKTVIKTVAAAVGSDSFDGDFGKLLKRAYIASLDNVKKQAEADGNDIGDYDTTLTAVVYDGKTCYYGQCGDGGAIILDTEGRFSCLTPIEKGEAFNETYPLRGGPEHWFFGKSNVTVCSVTLMTDGIFDLVCPPLLSNQEQTIYIPFIRKFMDINILKAKTESDFDKLQDIISNYIKSDKLKNVVDDKTIVGLINTELTPKVREDSYYAEPDWDALYEKQRSKLYDKDDTPVKISIDNIKFKDDDTEQIPAGMTTAQGQQTIPPVQPGANPVPGTIPPAPPMRQLPHQPAQEDDDDEKSLAPIIAIIAVLAVALIVTIILLINGAGGKKSKDKSSSKSKDSAVVTDSSESGDKGGEPGDDESEEDKPAETGKVPGSDEPSGDTVDSEGGSDESQDGYVTPDIDLIPGGLVDNDSTAETDESKTDNFDFDFDFNINDTDTSAAGDEDGDNNMTTSKSVLVPNVLGKTEEQATDFLSKRGLTVEVRYEEEGNTSGTVFSQEPNHGSSVEPGSTVIIYIG